MIDKEGNKKNIVYILYPSPQSFQAQVFWHKEQIYFGEKKTWLHLTHSSICFTAFSWLILEWHISSSTQVMRSRTFLPVELNLLLRDFGDFCSGLWLFYIATIITCNFFQV